MINDRSLAGFLPLAPGLLLPRYDDYSFGNIPTTVEYLLTGQARGPLLPADCFGGAYPRPRRIVLFLIDSFGWQFWQQYADRYRTTRRVVERGVLTPISALFPSTTSASISTLNLGVLPAQHALYEWALYIPAYGEVIQSLPFIPLGRHPADTLLARGHDPRAMLAVHETLHQRLAARGVRSIQIAHRAYADSAYNTLIRAGAEVIRHETLAESLVHLRRALAEVDGPALFSLYFGAIDSVAHVHGPGTAFHAAEITAFWATVDALLSDVEADDTLYLFTADHGHVYADAAATLYLNERLPQLADWLPVSPTGQPIYPNGSPRDLFLHLRPEHREEALALLRRELDGLALVLTVDEALARGLFGPGPIVPELRRRLGDLLVLPYLGHFIYWRVPDLLENRFYGHHGGLTPEELLTVIGVVDSL